MGRNALFWLPLFVLYFSSTLAPADVLRLEALYYGGVVLLEVPSGYLSDRMGRRPVLVVAAVAWAFGSAVIAAGGSFAILAAGQLLLAMGMAFQSGTDTSLLYDTLAALDRRAELAVREANAQSWAFATLGVSALIGGLLGSVDLRLGHALSAVVGCVAIAAAVAMVEPPASGRAPDPLQQAGDLRRHASDPVLRWTLINAVGLTVAVHLPYELVQPWLELLVAPLDLGSVSAAPPLSGAVVFVMMMLASAFGRQGPKLAARLGAATTLLVAWALMVAVLGSMAIGVHVALLPLVALRSVPTALARPVLAGVTHPRLPSSLRATWLSVESLVGRLAFASVLALSAQALGADAGWSHAAMATLLVPAAAVSAGLALGAWSLRPHALRAQAATPPGGPQPPPTPPGPVDPR